MKKMYINGAWIESKSGKMKEIINPYSQETLATVTVGGKEDAVHAIKSAKSAFENGDWRQYTGEERGNVLFEIAISLEEYKEELARLETLNVGKTLTESLEDIDGVINVFKYYAGFADKNGGEMINSPNPNSISKVVREPVGVCGLISPWNYPLLQLSYKVAPALAAGNTIVIKPSEITPLSTIKMVEIIEKVGLPPGVVNLLLGKGSIVGQELTENSDVDLISFTGGTETGRKVMNAATINFKKISLELGGNSPNIVFADADFETAVDYAISAIFFNAGQVCNSGTRLLVERSVHNDFVDAVVKKAKNIRLGSGLDSETEMGPLVSSSHLKNIEEYIQIAIDEGATLALGGKRPEEESLQEGFFIEPTIFNHCHTDMRIVQEETFGPILTIETFSTEEEAIQLANDTIYGLAGAIWTQDLNRAERIAHQLRVGTVWINDYHMNFPQAPWGGYKQSGIGREMGRAGLEEYTELKHVYTNMDPKPMEWFGNQK